MSKLIFFLYLDILGFKSLAEEIAEKKGLERRLVREIFINKIKDKVEQLEQKNIILGKKYGESDDWLLIAESCDNIFCSVSEILDHATGFDNYQQIPLEIAIGIGEFDKWSKFDGTNLIIEDSTIDFFKTNIIKSYHQYFKKSHKLSPKSTFIVCTEQAYHCLEPLDRKLFSRFESIQIGASEQKSSFYYTSNLENYQRRGVVLKFLKKIDYEDNRWYKRIPELYIPPIEYKDILKTLHEKKIVFITGTQEYGKTFTAVNLLWEYYNKGYDPIWYKGGSLRERDEIEKNLEDIKTLLKPHQIIYFEDPFGIIKYEERTRLEREIGTILDIVAQKKDTYITEVLHILDA